MKRYIVLMLFFAWLFAGCVKNDVGIPQQESVETTLTLRVAGNAATRALGAGDEDEIGEIDILVFSKPMVSDPDAGAVYSYRARTTRIIPAENNGSEKSFRVTLKKSDDYQRLVVLANARSVIESLIAGFGGKTYEEVMAELVMTEAGAWNSTTGAYDPLPMWGQSGFKVFTEAASASCEIELIRSLARIDVVVDATAQDDFILSGVWFYNPSTKGLLAPLASNWNAAESEAVAVSLPSVGRAASPTPFPYTTLTTDDIALQGVIYTFEAPAAAENTSSADACLVVKGSWNGETDSYYRIDFHDGADFLPLLRNFHYIVSINEVKGRGYPNETEALSSGFTALTAVTQVWNEGDMGSVVWDGSHYLTVSINEYTVYPEPQAITGISAGTNYPEGWKATVTLDLNDEPDWFTIDSGSLAGAGDKAPHAIHMTLLANAGNHDRTAVVTVTAGRLKQEITIVQKVDPLLSLDVGDVEVIFSASNPESFSLPVEWEPAANPVTLELVHAGTAAAAGYPQLNGYTAGISFGGDNILAEDEPTLADADGITTNGGLAMLVMLPDAADLATFEERRSILKITSAADQEHTKTKTVLLRQFDYAIQVNGMSPSYQLGTTYSLTLKANAQWTVGISGDTGEIAVPVTEGEPNTSGVTFKFTTGNTEGKRSVLKFYLNEREDIYQEIDISLYKLDPNCYILYPQQQGMRNYVDIPIRKVYEAWANDKDLNGTNAGNAWAMRPGSTYTTGLLWQDKKGLIYDIGNLSGGGRDATFRVTANRIGIEGNAVVYLAENGIIRWSWHIWVLKGDDDPTIGISYTNRHTGAIIMDRDLGAITNFAPINDADVDNHGLLYQWGRKDPLPGASAVNSTLTKMLYNIDDLPLSGIGGFQIENVSVDYNLANSVMNPLVFYSNPRTSYYDSWWYSNQPQSIIDRTDLWNSNNVKTIYDPCPEGWRVSVSSFLEKVMYDVNNYNKDRGIELFDAAGNFMGFFPMSGYRNQMDGGLYSVGTDWHSRISMRNQGIMIGHTSLTATAGITNGRGLSVRCVKIQ